MVDEYTSSQIIDKNVENFLEMENVTHFFDVNSGTVISKISTISWNLISVALNVIKLFGHLKVVMEFICTCPGNSWNECATTGKWTYRMVGDVEVLKRKQQC